jgi:hypothetical protein
LSGLPKGGTFRLKESRPPLDREKEARAMLAQYPEMFRE